jgi:diguanylate cyclase (GGDEF)-like protein/PAS domain S-box-containing protein
VKTQIPSVEIGTGVSQDPDSLDAGLDASIEAISNIRRYRISIVLVYASVHYDLDKVLKGIRRTVGDVSILGTTTAGEICGGMHQHSVTVVAIASPYLSVHAAVGNAVSKDWRKALSHALDNPAISSFVKGNQNVSMDMISSGKSLFAMLFYPGNTKEAGSRGYELLETFKLTSLGRIPVFGGAAADDWHMKGNSVFFGDQVHHDSVLVALFETQLEIGISISHGFIPTGHPMVVNAAEGHEIISLNNAPAANVIANSVGMRREDLEGQHVTLASGRAFGSPDPMGQYSVNVASYFTPGGGIRMTQPVSVGMELTVLDHNAANTVLASEDAFRKSIIRSGTHAPALVLVHYCALRARIFGEAMVQMEIENLLKIAGSAPTAGFFSFGEDAVADDGVSRHNNGAIAVLILGHQLSSTAKVAQENKQLQHQIAAQTEQRVLVEALRQMEESIVVIDIKSLITYVNSAFSNLFGYISDEVVGYGIDTILLGESSTAISFKEIILIATEKSVYREETQYKRNDGQLVSIRLTVSRLTNTEGVITEFVVAITDLTSSILSSQDKEASDARYRAAFQTSLDSINITRMSDGQYLDVNESFLKTTGWEKQDVIGRTSSDINVWHDPADRTRLVEILQKNHECRDLEARFNTKNGGLIYGSMSASIVIINGETCILSCTRDITERKLAEAALRDSEGRFRRIMDHAPIGMATTALDGHFLLINQAFCTMLGYGRDELEKLTFQDVTHPEDKNISIAERQLMLDGKLETYRLEKRYIRKDGQVVWGVISSTLERNNFGKPPYFIAQVEDITERKETENQLIQHKVAIETTNDGFWLTDEKGILLKVNQAYAKMSGYSLGELLGMHISQLEAKEQSLEEIKAHVAKIISQGGDVFETRHRTKEGHEIDLEVSASLIPDSKLIVSFLRDISDRKKYDAELIRIANYDALTGIPNRVLLADRMKQAIAQTSREKNMMAVCYLDLDGFKPINDTLGHEAGDTVLIEVAKRIGDTIRGGDTNARLGGDEFVVLLLGLEKGEECVATLERLLMAIAEPIIVKNKSVSVSASIGVSIYPMDDEDPDTLLRHADQAMYVAKQSGKNRFHIYDPALDRRARDEHEFLKSIRYALENNQFELHYQPKVNLRTKELVGAEALIRWRHPERGILPPSTFLHHIENTDLDIEIGEWVTATALAQIDSWQKEGLTIDVSINISGYHLESIQFVEILKQQLALYPSFSFGKLQIEILETVALNDISVVREIIGSCRKLGVGFALDDFGTGYSSLSYLSGLPVDVLKIDQSFVRDMQKDKGDRAIVQGIIALAKAFERQTVAEGIETSAHYQALLDMGCELGQGYAIARPMPASEMMNWRMPHLGT